MFLGKCRIFLQNSIYFNLARSYNNGMRGGAIASLLRTPSPVGSRRPRQCNLGLTDATRRALEHIKEARGVALWRLFEATGRLILMAHGAERLGGKLALRPYPATELTHKRFPPRREIVPGMIHEGLGVSVYRFHGFERFKALGRMALS
jgi:hypothetical protein